MFVLRGTINRCAGIPWLIKLDFPHFQCWIAELIFYSLLSRFNSLTKFKFFSRPVLSSIRLNVLFYNNSLHQCSLLLDLMSSFYNNYFLCLLYNSEMKLIDNNLSTRKIFKIQYNAITVLQGCNYSVFQGKVVVCLLIPRVGHYFENCITEGNTVCSIWGGNITSNLLLESHINSNVWLFHCLKCSQVKTFTYLNAYYIILNYSFLFLLCVIEHWIFENLQVDWLPMNYISE